MKPVLKPLRKQRGISLIELMVGMTLGLLLLAALASLYASTSQSRVQLNNSATQIENGRYALDIISQEVRLAGYLGDLNLLGTSNIATPDVCAVATNALGFTNSPATVPMAIYGYAAGANAATCLSNLSPNSEILVVRRVSTTPVTIATMVAGQAYLQDSFCSSDATPFIFSTAALDFNMRDKTCSSSNLAELRQVSVRAFYIATCDLCNGNDNGVLTLKMAELSGGAMVPKSIAQGIQDVHFSYGVDVDGNGSPDCYVANPGIDNSTLCNNVGGYNWTNSATTNWSNVTAVRISVLAGTLKPTPGWTDNRTYDLGRGANAMSGPFNDAYKRHVYAEVARAVNVAGPRE